MCVIIITPDVVWCNLRDSITNKHYYTISCHQPSEKTWTLSSKQNIITTAHKYNHWEPDTVNITNLLGLESRKKYFMLEQIWKWLHNRMYWKSIFIPTKSEPISFIFSLTKRITKLTSLFSILCSLFSVHFFSTNILFNTKRKLCFFVLRAASRPVSPSCLYQWSIKPYHEIDLISIRQFIFHLIVSWAAINTHLWNDLFAFPTQPI